MDTNKTVSQQISAFADGDLDDMQTDRLLKLLRDPDARAQWDTYHEIGDALRSNELATVVSAGFSKRMSARLASEPTHLGTGVSSVVAATDNAFDVAMRRDRPRSGSSFLRFGVPGAAMAAAVLLAVVAGPRFTESSHDTALASAGGKQAIIPAAGSGARERIVLRDAQIDEYLSAHQRFSPSLYTARYARTSTFATDSNK